MDETEVALRMAEAAESVYGDYVVGVFGGVLKLAIFMTLVTQMFRYAWQPFFLRPVPSHPNRRPSPPPVLLLAGAPLRMDLPLSATPTAIVDRRL